MVSINKKSAKLALEKGVANAQRAGTVAKSAAKVAARAGAKAAMDAGTAELKRGWKATSPAVVKAKTRQKIGGVLLGAAALTAAGVAVARSRSRKRG